MAKNKKSNEIKIKVKGGGNSIFSSLLVKILIFIIVIAFILSAIVNCGRGCGGNGLFKAPSWLENILPERPDWLPDWFPSLFEKEEEIDGSNGDESSDCEHIDENEDGVCDKCEARLEIENLTYTITFNPNGGELTVDYTTKQTNEDGTLSGLPGAYREGYTFTYWSISENGDEPITLQTVYKCDTTLYAQYEETCQHCDENYDEYCDICGEKYYCLHIDEDGDAICDKCELEIPDDPDGGESSDCEHIDENVDSFCDKCGAILSDGDEPSEDPEPEDPECEHRDADDDGLCDNCGETFSDGDEPSEDPEPEDPECEHRDADDDLLCDKCGEEFNDGNDGENEGNFADILINEAGYAEYFEGIEKVLLPDDFYEGRDSSKFYISFYVRTQEDGDFATPDAAERHYFTSFNPRNGHFDQDGDGLNDDTGEPVRVNPYPNYYCHSTDIAIDDDFGGGWNGLSRYLSGNSIAQDCLDDHREYYLVIEENLVLLTDGDRNHFVVGFRFTSDTFEAVNLDMSLISGVVYELLPLEDYEGDYEGRL